MINLSELGLNVATNQVTRSIPPASHPGICKILATRVRKYQSAKLLL